MVFRAFATVCLMMMASLAQGADERLEVVSVNLLGYVGEKLEVAVDLPCGSEYIGLVAVPAKEGRLHVAGLVKSSDFMCTSMPEGKRVLINYLATHDFKTIAPMDVSRWKGRFVMAPIRDLRLFDKKKSSGKALQGVYNTKCGQHVGTVIRQTDTQKLEVAFLEHLVRGSRTTDCPSEQKVRGIKAIKLSKGLKIATLRRDNAKDKQVFQLRLAKINGKSFRRLEKGGLSFQYLRACNEAPVGIVVGKRSVAKKRAGGAPVKRATFGMLVAHYGNMDCDAGQAAEAWTAYATHDVSLPRGWRARLMPATKISDNLVLQSPLEMAKLTKNSKKGLFVDFIRGCDLTMGAVYARSMWASSESVLAVGVLSRKAGNQCKKPVSQASLFQPFVSQGVAVTDMFPLKIRGDVAH